MSYILGMSDELEWSEPKPSENMEVLWQEYEYRHKHIWDLVIKISAVVIGLSVIPYLPVREGVAPIPPGLAVFPTVAAFFLSVLAFLRLRREFLLFDSVKKAYLKRTGRWRDKERKRPSMRVLSFRSQVLIYHALLSVGTLINALILIAKAAD